jgi:flagellar basal-body rod modification protein FlgD
MAINAYGNNVATTAASSTTATTNTKDGNPKGVLGKDDFMKLLLVQLQYQDPTEPTDTEKILTQTSQLAALESADNTNTALEKLSASLSNSQQFGTIAAIGRTADLGSDSIAHEKGSSTAFEVYFQTGVEQGSVDIKDGDGNVVQTLDVGTNPSGVYQFTWDGSDKNGNNVDSGIYHVTANFTDGSGATHETRLGAYPIESVRFDNGSTLVKLGSSYVPLENVKEVY